MTSREILTQLFNEANRLACEEPKYTTHDLWEMCKQIEKDLEILETLKKYIRVNELRETPQIMTGSPDVDIVQNVVKKALDSSIFLDLMLQEDAKKIKEWLK